jgi:drug/metabolite transporter (DMT)-like permease
MATKRTYVYSVVIGGQFVGLVALLTLVLLFGERVPPLRSWILAALAGIGGGIGLVFLYRALAGGQMSVAAPISAVLAAIIPVLVGALLQGLPGLLTILGLFLALLAIWLISRGDGSQETRPFQREEIRLPFIAGIVFGLFFVLLHQASQEAILWPIIATRLTSIVFLASFAAVTRQPWRAKRTYWPLIALSGLLDTGGNGFYVLAGQLGRMDVAAVVSSLYPGATVALAWLVLKERVSRPQMIGIAAALLAIVLITI